MRIAVNTRLLIKDKLEGIGWFTYEVLIRIVRNNPQHEFLFFFDRPYASDFVFASNVTPIVLYPQARHPILFNIWFDYSLSRALKKHKADVFFSPDGMLSLTTKVPQVNVVHDLNFEHYPEDLPKHITRYYKKKFPQFVQKATAVITVSNFSKKDICSKYNIAKDKVSVAYNGAGKDYLPLTHQQRAQKMLQINNGIPYLIYVGALHKRKNIERMLLAFKALKEKHLAPLEFIVVGDFLWKKNGKLSAISEHVKFVGRKSGPQLADLVGCSQGLVYVSYFEGFGIPILEGMKAGVPVVSGNRTSMPEVGGEAVVYVDPFNVKAITAGMETILADGAFEKFRKKGIAQALKFDWDNSANQIWKVIESNIS